ncbi:MAG: nitroreductase family protein [Lachnospiraceae bacterium]|nr:nitroreductase family protein [Lachnospiraceae bacterium]
MKVSEAITKRYSTRGYTEEELSKEEIRLLLEAGLKAPTASNKQEIHFSVLKGDDPLLKEMDQERNRLKKVESAPHNFYYEAPVVIFLSGDKSFRWTAVDAGIAVENMALMAEEMGLGNLIIGCVYDVLRGEREDYYAQKLAFPEGYEYQVAIALGHKAAEKAPHTFDFEKNVSFLF